jgi:signal peptidase I
VRILAWTALVLLVARRFLVVVTVRGGSMRPTYADGDLLLAVRSPLLRRGRPIVFEPPLAEPDRGGPRYRVKRLVAVAGDPTPAWVRGAVPTSAVPPGRLVVRGDSARSEDSSTYGFVNRSAVVAVVLGRLHAQVAAPGNEGITAVSDAGRRPSFRS